jgi:hypothetical protein
MTTNGHMPTPEGPSLLMRILTGVLILVAVVTGLAVLAALLVFGTCMLR